MATTTKLIFKQPEGAPDKYSLSREGEYTVGTAKNCDITLEDDSLEEEHGKLVPDETNEARWFLQILSSKAIIFLEDGATEQIGNTTIEVSITEEESDDPEDDQADESKEEEAAAAERDRELAELKRAQQMRDFRNATVLIVFLALLSFAAGIAWRLLK